MLHIEREIMTESLLPRDRELLDLRTLRGMGKTLNRIFYGTDAKWGLGFQDNRDLRASVFSALSHRSFTNVYSTAMWPRAVKEENTMGLHDLRVGMAHFGESKGAEQVTLTRWPTRMDVKFSWNWTFWETRSSHWEVRWLVSVEWEFFAWGRGWQRELPSPHGTSAHTAQAPQTLLVQTELFFLFSSQTCSLF